MPPVYAEYHVFHLAVKVFWNLEIQKLLSDHNNIESPYFFSWLIILRIRMIAFTWR